MPDPYGGPARGHATAETPEGCAAMRGALAQFYSAML